MKLIVNRGFENLLSKVIVYKNGIAVGAIPVKSDHITFNAQAGDTIVVRVRSAFFCSWNLTSFVCQPEKDTYLLSPSMLCKVWEAMNYWVLPYLYLLLKILPLPGGYQWIATGVIVLLAVSLVSSQVYKAIPTTRQKSLKLDAW